MSVGFSETFHRFYRPLLPGRARARSLRARARASAGRRTTRSRPRSRASRTTLRRTHGTIAAVVVEPLMQGAAGMWPQPVEYLREVRALTRRYDTLLVCDEVATGFGRTGRLFACDHSATTPDLLVLGKGLTGGYLPLAATLATEEIFRAFLGPYDGYTAFFHGHTFTGNALACAAALASLDLFTPALLASLPEKAAALAAALAPRIRPLASVFEIRQRGLMVGIELMRDPDRRAGYAPAERIGHRVILAARRRGVVLRPLGDVLVLMPPLSITADEIATLVAVAAESIAEVTARVTPLLVTGTDTGIGKTIVTAALAAALAARGHRVGVVKPVGDRVPPRSRGRARPSPPRPATRRRSTPCVRIACPIRWRRRSPPSAPASRSTSTALRRAPAARAPTRSTCC